MTTSTFGELLSQWRRARGKSQLDLAIEASVSPRHVSFVETGRSTPSRDMVLMLATALHVPYREQNALLLAAGYAPGYRETRLEAPELAYALRALDLILGKHEPYPAVVLNRQWDIIKTNNAARSFFASLLGKRSSSRQVKAAPNVLRLMFDPKGLRPYVTNWEIVAEALIQRVHRESLNGVADDATKALLKEVLAYRGVPKKWSALDPTQSIAPLIPIAFEKGKLKASYFSTVTTLGTAQDITLQELRIECFFPVGPADARS